MVINVRKIQNELLFNLTCFFIRLLYLNRLKSLLNYNHKHLISKIYDTKKVDDISLKETVTYCLINKNSF
ncbi:hypothetical protein CFSAN001628_001210 [Clostridium botulinum CFSAN001628]|nr:hypothetical protein CFSAN001628_001210 [Clostridium botulinum CFSAN001628]